MLTEFEDNVKAMQQNTVKQFLKDFERKIGTENKNDQLISRSMLLNISFY